MVKNSIISARTMQNPLKMNSFYYREISKPLEFAVLKLNSTINH